MAGVSTRAENVPRDNTPEGARCPHLEDARYVHNSVFVVVSAAALAPVHRARLGKDTVWHASQIHPGADVVITTIQEQGRVEALDAAIACKIEKHETAGKPEEAVRPSRLVESLAPGVAVYQSPHQHGQWREVASCEVIHLAGAIVYHGRDQVMTPRRQRLAQPFKAGRVGYADVGVEHTKEFAARPLCGGVHVGAVTFRSGVSNHCDGRASTALWQVHFLGDVEGENDFHLRGGGLLHQVAEKSLDHRAMPVGGN